METNGKPTASQGETKLKVGDYVQLVGIVYEVGIFGHVRLHIADGTKVRSLFEPALRPASPLAIKAFKAEAIEGITPAAIIAREAEEKAAKAKADAIIEEGGSIETEEE